MKNLEEQADFLTALALFSIKTVDKKVAFIVGLVKIFLFMPLIEFFIPSYVIFTDMLFTSTVKHSFSNRFFSSLLLTSPLLLSSFSLSLLSFSPSLSSLHLSSSLSSPLLPISLLSSPTFSGSFPPSIPSIHLLFLNPFLNSSLLSSHSLFLTSSYPRHSLSRSPLTWPSCGPYAQLTSLIS